MTGVPTSSSSWTKQTLDPLRLLGDPLADEVIAKLFAEGDVAAVNAVMRDFVVNEYPVPEALPAVLRDYFATADKLPDWADPRLLEAAEELFWRFGPKFVLILTCYSLPFCYLGQNGVPVLALTTRLSSNPTRRIVETAQMMIDVMQAGGLTSPEGRGRRTIQKVRLMHAAIRKLAPTAPQWKASYGLPVNQEDLAGTLMSFSWIALDGLAKLNVSLTEADREAYLHLWNVVGHLLGVQPQLLPANVGQAQALTNAIAAHQFGPSPEGKSLTAALTGMIAHTLPGNVFDHSGPLLIRFFLGKQWAEWLGLEEGFLAQLAALPFRVLGIEFSGLLEDSKALSALAEHASQVLINALVFCERGGNRPSFSIPADLREQWAVNWTS